MQGCRGGGRGRATKITLRPITPLRADWALSNFLLGVPIPFMENGYAAHLTLVRDGGGNRDGIGTKGRCGRCTGNGCNVQGRNHERGVWSRCLFRTRRRGEGRKCGEGSEGWQGCNGASAGEGCDERRHGYMH